MAILGTQGFGSLPRYCTLLMGLLFGASVAICGLRDALPGKYGKFVPSPMSMGLPFYLGECRLNLLLVGRGAYSDRAGCGLCWLVTKQLNSVLPVPSKPNANHTPTHPPHPTSGANNALNFWIGSLVVHFWTWLDAAGADDMSAIIGSGLLVGSGVFAIPSAILSLTGALPPVCMSFSSAPPKST
jgi:hypothetical protein